MKHPSGWYPDPYVPGHEQFWDGREWTGQLRAAPAKSRRRSAATPPPPPPPPDFETAAARSGPAVTWAAAATAPEATPMSSGLTEASSEPEPSQFPRHAAAPTYWDKAAPQSVAANGSAGAGRHAAASPMPPVKPRNPDAAMARLTASFARADDAVVRTTGPVKLERKPEMDNGAVKKSPGPTNRVRWRPIVRSVAVVVVVVVIAAGAVALLRHKFGTSAATTPIGTAAAATLKAGTATMAFAVNPAAGQAPASRTTFSGLSGNGEVDLSSGATTLTLTEPASAGSAGTTEQLIADNQTLYLAPGPFVDQLESGKAWISATADDLGASGTPSGFEVPAAVYEELIGNPAVLLEQLQGAGVTATSLGSSTYDGTPVNGYAVTLTNTDIGQRLSLLPASLQSGVSGMSATEDVYVTTAGLVRAIVAPATVEVNGQTSTEDVQVLFSGWGGPVQIAPPPPVSVMTWAKLKYILSYTNKLR